jgi:energy-coupling factor transporter ATP-binding protein EcfA2
MVQIKLADEIVTITGPPDSGKSNLVKYLLTLPQYQSHLVYDPLFGFDPDIHNVIRPPDRSTKYRRYEEGNPELNKAVDEFILTRKDKWRPSYFIIDEAGRLLPNQKDEGSAMGELNDFNAHYGISVWLIGQRLAQLNSDFENKATHHFVMGYKGKNDKQALSDIHENLPEYVQKTSRYGFTYVGKNGEIANIKPVDIVGEKGEL